MKKDILRESKKENMKDKEKDRKIKKEQIKWEKEFRKR